MYDYFTVEKVLIIAPIRVADFTWDAEIHKWDHLQHLTISKILGNVEQRKQAINVEADLYTINRENVQWLVSYLGNDWKFDMVVVDELSSFKNAKAKRFKALKQAMVKVSRFVGLTGTPAPRNYTDLWPELYLMDRGERLGRTLTEFHTRYFKPGKSNGHVVYEWNLIQGSERKIYDAIGDICMSLKAKDWLSLPKRTNFTVDIELPNGLFREYKQFEREKILELEDNHMLVGSNAGVVMGKLLQFAAGMVYDDNHEPIAVHDYKLEALSDLVIAANGKPLLVFYYFKFDFERIKNTFKDLDVRQIESQKDVEDWNKGNIDILLVHPASVGHGLNLQEGGNTIVWYTLPNWNLELYQQANARLHRQGQKKPVFVYHLLSSGTVDEDVMHSLEQKDVSQQALMDALKAKIS